MPAQYFPQQRMPPPGLPPPGFEYNPPFNYQQRGPPGMLAPGVPFSGFGHQDARGKNRYCVYKITKSIVLYFTELVNLTRHRVPISFQMPPKAAPTSMGLGNVDNDVSRRLAGNSPMPQRTIQVPGRTARRPAPPESSPPEVKILRPQDPEPGEYLYKEDIRVADRLAKGEGAVYLVAPSDSDPGTFHIYLEGSKYLEYPVVSMYNYITTSTDLCPQFKEADGVSITTTRLVFGGQEKIAKFMTALRALKTRKPEPTFKATPASAAAKPTDSPVSASPGKPAPSTHADKESVPPASKPAKVTSVKATVPHPKSDDRQTYEVKPTFNVPKDTKNTNPGAKDFSIELVLDYGGDDYGMACDLVDLSQPADVSAPRSSTRSALSSAYAMDLGSLQSSLFATPTESFDFIDGIQELNSPSETAKVGTPKTEPATEPVAEPVAEPAVEPPTEPATKTSAEHSQPIQNDAVSPADQMEGIESLQNSLLEILPKFEAMGRILDGVEETKREAAAKSVFASLRESLGDTTDVQLSSAEQLLRALLVKLAKEKPTATKAADTVCRLRYARDEIEMLRDHALPPPEILFKLEFLPRTSKHDPPKTGTAQTQHSPSSSRMDNKMQSSLKPTAEPFQPSPPPKTRHSALSTQFASSGPASDAQPAILSPTALSHASSSSNATNIDSLTARMSRLALPDTQTKTPTKGLQGSRWATTSDSVRTENANRFMGIAIPL